MQVSRKSVVNAKRVMREDPQAHEAAKRGERVRKEKDPKMKIQAIAQEMGAARPGNLNSDYLKKFKAEVEEISPGAIENNDETAYRKACEIIRERNSGKTLEQRYEEHRREVATLSETAAQKLERLASKEKDLLREMFKKELHEEAEKLAPQYRDRMRHWSEESSKLATIRKGIQPQINEDDYKFLLNVLHPDRAPEDRRDRFAKAFDIVRKLDKYIEATKFKA
jgi:hypothetical protein